jgi:hypothetical protein
MRVNVETNITRIRVGAPVSAAMPRRNYTGVGRIYINDACPIERFEPPGRPG